MAIRAPNGANNAFFGWGGCGAGERGGCARYCYFYFVGYYLPFHFLVSLGEESLWSPNRLENSLHLNNSDLQWFDRIWNIIFGKNKQISKQNSPWFPCPPSLPESRQPRW